MFQWSLEQPKQNTHTNQDICIAKHSECTLTEIKNRTRENKSTNKHPDNGVCAPRAKYKRNSNNRRRRTHSMLTKTDEQLKTMRSDISTGKYSWHDWNVVKYLELIVCLSV